MTRMSCVARKSCPDHNSWPVGRIWFKLDRFLPFLMLLDRLSRFAAKTEVYPDSFFLIQVPAPLLRIRVRTSVAAPFDNYP